MKLTPHFALQEFTNSGTAARLGIDNTPPPEIIRNIQLAAENMERVRVILGNNPITVTSGFRSQRLNAALNGSATSSHLTGFAVDFVCPRFGTLRQICQAIIDSDTQFDQLILYNTFVHISFDPRMRQQLMAAVGNGFRTGI